MLLLHKISSRIAFVSIVCFFVSSLVSEAIGNAKWIAWTKEGILWGLFILIPSLAITGMSGRKLGKSGAIVSRKLNRMKVIGANGVLILIPSAIFLYIHSSTGEFGIGFIMVQALEFIAGAINIILMTFNWKDGIRLRSKR